MPGVVLMPRMPDANDGPRRFIRHWLTFDATRPVRTGKMWMLIATVSVLLIASALLAWRTIPTPS